MIIITQASSDKPLKHVADALFSTACTATLEGRLLHLDCPWDQAFAEGGSRTQHPQPHRQAACHALPQEIHSKTPMYT